VGIKPNNPTRPLFRSDFLIAAHVAGYASRLHGYYGSGYRTSILVGVLESLRPGDPAPERGASLADIICPDCHGHPCRCGEEPDYADWEA
jgi:hypothetical protein